MKREVLKKNIEILNLDGSIIKKLKENNIKIVDNNYDLGIAIDRVLRLFRKQYSLLLLILLV